MISTKIKKLVKIFVDYTIDGEQKIYTLKHTPFCIRRAYCTEYHKLYEPLPIVPNKIIFDNYMGKGYGCNCKYVLQELLTQNRPYEYVWTVKNVQEHRSEFPEQVRLVEYGSAEAMREYATAAVWVSNYQMIHYLNKGLLKKEGQSYIQMWHGSFGIKKIEKNCNLLERDKNWVYLAQRNSEYTDYWISNSIFESNVYREAFWKINEILEYGHPRNDLFYKESIEQERARIRRILQTGDKRSMLYVPTFRDDTMVGGESMDYEAVQQALEQRFGGEWIILIRLHPRMRDYAEQIIPDVCTVKNVTEYPDIQELLLVADAAITDYSSAIFDYLLTKRPGFIYANDYDRYRDLRGMYYPLEETPFTVATSNEQLVEHILGFEEEEYDKRVTQFLEQKGSVEDGQASIRVAALINQLIKKESNI